MSYIDTNVNNYTDDELFTILSNPNTKQEIVNTTNSYMKKYKNENNSNMYNFFKDIQTRLLSSLSDTGEDEYDGENNNQTNEWWKNNPALNQDDTTQSNKITDRTQKIDVYDNTHLPMARQQLGVNNNFNVPVAQDKLNPNLENITSRLIVLDSLYRQASNDGENSSATDYVCDLSDQLRNVLSLRLYSYQIPYSWYVFDSFYGNTCFWVYNNLQYFEINIPSGNYTPSTFITQLIQVFYTAGFSGVSSTNLYYTSSTGKITINLDGITDPSGSVIYGTTFVENQDGDTITNPRLIFFDYTKTLTCTGNSSCSISNNYTFNNTLGWIMGFRTASENILIGGNTCESIFDYYGPRYFILIIDDYNQNHINNGLVTITELSTKLPIPSYFTTDTAYVCNNFDNTISSNNTNADLYIETEKVIDGTKTIPQIIPSAPRTITNSQIYTINQIIKNNSRNTKYKVLPANPSDSFAVIGLDKNNLSLGQFMTENGSSLQTNKRIYFGPVNIDRLRIRLLDDRGNIVNLNGMDFNIILIAELLYQY